MAAEEVRQRAGVMPPITIKKAGYHHESVFTALKVLWGALRLRRQAVVDGQRRLRRPGRRRAKPMAQRLGQSGQADPTRRTPLISAPRTVA